MKKLSKKIRWMILAAALYSLTLPCFAGDFFWREFGPDFSYEEHLEWQKNFQWNRKQAFQIYKKQYKRHLKQRSAWLRERLRSRNKNRIGRQQSKLKKEWDAKQKAHRRARVRITEDYIQTRNRRRRQKKSGNYSPQRAEYSREFAL